MRMLGWKKHKLESRLPGEISRPRGLTVGQTQPQELAAPQPPDTTGAEPTRTPGLHRPWTQSLYSSREDFTWADAHQEGRAEGGHPALPGNAHT